MPTLISSKDKYSFKNVHGNYRKSYFYHTRLFNDPTKKNFAAYNDTTEEIKKLIWMCAKEKVRIRACGSKWSLSEVPYAKGMLIFSVNPDNKPDLKFKGFLNDNYLEQAGEKNEFLFAQCGNTIKDLNLFCQEAKRSLPTSGDSNGQTIAGAISTGVNGSAYQFGCIQDAVVGLHIVRGDGEKDSIYLESASNPVANQQFADRIKATLIRDDDLFHAALVSMGTFGYIHGVMIQTVPVFRLLNMIKKVDINDAYKFTKTLDIRNSVLDLDGLDADALYHIKFYINQYQLQDNVRAEIIYKLFPGQRVGFLSKKLKYIKDFILFKLAKVVATWEPETIPELINPQLPKDGDYEVGFLNDIFGDSTPRSGQWACAIAVDVVDTERVTKLMIAHFDQPDVKKIPSAFSFRFVKKSKAMLAFTKFENNCIIGIDGIKNRATKEYLKEISQILVDSGIPHTWHWGKRHVMDADFIQKMYGNQLPTWRKKRTEFLSPVVAQIFSSRHLDKLGLTTIYS